MRRPTSPPYRLPRTPLDQVSTRKGIFTMPKQLERRAVLPAILRPGMYVGEQGERTPAEWMADAVCAYLRPAKRGRPLGAASFFKVDKTPLAGLRAARLKAGFTQEQAGAVIGTNKSHYGKLELGTVRLDTARAGKLAKLFGVTVDSFLNVKP